MAKKQKKNKGGRPRVPVDVSLVDQLCIIQCTGEEVAAVLGIDYDALNRALKRQTGKGFADYFASKAPSGRMSLRRVQWQAAMAGDRTMLVWLGKNVLGQLDRQDHRIDARVTTDDDGLDLSKLSNEELDALERLTAKAAKPPRTTR